MRVMHDMLRGGYFAIGTWVIAEVARLIVKNNQSSVIGAGTGTSLEVPFDRCAEGAA